VLELLRIELQAAMQQCARARQGAHAGVRAPDDLGASALLRGEATGLPFSTM